MFTNPHMNLPCLLIALAVVFVASLDVMGQSGTVLELFTEVENYIQTRSKELSASGKRITADTRNDIAEERRDLAAKHAAAIAARPDLEKIDHYYLGRLYGYGGNDPKQLESMKKLLSSFPPDTKGDMIQSARSFVIVISSKRKQMAEAEAAFELWKTGYPFIKSQQPALQDHLALGFYKNGDFESAVKHAQEAFGILKA